MGKMQKQQSNTNRTIRRRTVFIAGMMIVVGFGTIVYNLCCIQIRDYEMYQAEASAQQLRATTIPANRGIIYDSNMKVLSKSADVWNISVSPKEIKKENIDKVANGLANLLEVDAIALKDRIAKSNSYYESVKKKVEKPLADAVRAWIKEEEIVGVNIDQDTKRYYPYGDFASTILGFTGSDNNGLAGLELYYDDELSGTPGRSVQATNAWGYEMPYAEDSYHKPVDGGNLVLTLDEVIQHSLEKNLDVAVKTHDVQARATGIVMDVNTGGILAMATHSAYDPNDPYNIYDETKRAEIEAIIDDPLTTEIDEHHEALFTEQQQQWRNKGVMDLYEPGSVFKLVTAAAALDSGSATLESTYNCVGSLDVAGTKMRCAHPEGHGGQTFEQTLINSCNPAFIQIGTNLGADTFFEYFEAFGLTQASGIDLMGEAKKSSYYTADKLGPVQLASSSFGQSIKITPIQMITAAAATVNGGHLLQPHMVSQILDSEGNITESMELEPKRQVISEETSAQIRGIIEKSATNAAVAGYRIGGKSGTSQKLDSGDPEARIASYVAFAPIDDPEIAVLIILDEPNSYSDYGGTIAAPVAGKVLTEVLPYIGIQPVYSEDENEQISSYLGDHTDKILVEAQTALQKQGFFQKAVGDGTTVVRQYPEAGIRIPKGSTVILYTEEGLTDNMISVPNVVGRNTDTATQAITSAGLNVYKEGAYSSEGSIKAVAQSVAPGTKVPIGTVVTVTFGDINVYD